MKLKTIIIGSGFSSLSASCYLAQAGYDVTILEKNATVGGRARQLKRDGFTFDLGPSWYFEPFEKYAIRLMNEHLINSYYTVV